MTSPARFAGLILKLKPGASAGFAATARGALGIDVRPLFPNATAAGRSLERGLAAFIPLDEGVARRRHWPMPARKLVERLEEKTRGRLTKSDKDANEVASPSFHVTERYVEVTLPPAEVADRPPVAEAPRMAE
jgi:hypothetical protein